MKSRSILLFIGLFLCSYHCKSLTTIEFDSLNFQKILVSMFSDLELARTEYLSHMDLLELEYAGIQKVLKNDKASDRELLQAFIKKSQILDEITIVERTLKIGLDKARYRKGLELIKLMYEKILGLDHHFHSLQTYQNIAQLSNPNAYSDFQQMQEVVNSRLSKKNGVKMPMLLESNPFLSASFTLVASILGDGEPKKKEEDLEKIACILDFTVRMNADLNTIYYETQFLKESNESLKEACDRLFKDYCKAIDYKISLEECRREDDWETVYELLDDYILALESMNTENDITVSRKFTRGIANLEFSIDRLLIFLNNYSDFINQGEQYYLKFQVIVSNYQNEDLCTEQLPHQFATLKQEIKYSIEKFKDAYFVSELNGSKLKDLLYGVE